jgi:hypothetical protein
MDRAPEFEAFIRDLMPDASREELEQAMQNMDDYIHLILRITERLEREKPSGIRAVPDRGV